MQINQKAFAKSQRCSEQTDSCFHLDSAWFGRLIENVYFLCVRPNGRAAAGCDCSLFCLLNEKLVQNIYFKQVHAKLLFVPCISHTHRLGKHFRFMPG